MRPAFHDSPSSRRRAPCTPVRRILIFLIVLSLASAGRPARAQAADPAAEYRIKAAFLYNFTKFVDWPPQAYQEDHSPFVIAVLSRDPAAAKVIREVLRDKTTAAGRAISVVAFSETDPIPPGAQLLYVGHSESHYWSRISAQVDTRPVLVVGEADGFAQHGGTINFIVAGDVVHIEINPRRAERAGLKVSGSLASVAQLVWDKEPN